MAMTKEWLRAWRKRNPHYNRLWLRRNRGKRKARSVILGVLCQWKIYG